MPRQTPDVLSHQTIISPFPPATLATAAIWSDATPDQRVVLEFLHALSAANHDGAARLLSPDAVWRSWGDFEFSGIFQGRERVLERFHETLGANFVDGYLSLYVHAITGSTSPVAAEFTLRNLVRRTGQWFQREFCAIAEVEAGVLTDVREYADTQYIKGALF